MRPDVSRRRALVVAVFLCAWMVVVGARLAYLQTGGRHEELVQKARAQQSDAEDLSPVRGLILDRQGRELARSVDVDSYFAVPVEIEDFDAAARKLSNVFGGDASALASRLREARAARKSFVWLARRVSDEQSRAVKELNIKGVHSRPEPRRRYPNGGLAAHVLGHVGLDDKGLAGIEQTHDSLLTGEAGRVVMEGDAKRRMYESFGVAPKPGQTVVLTIDQVVQFRTEQAIKSAMERTKAKSATAVVLDPRTGEILALANAPAFDPNNVGKDGATARANDALQNIYEPGSTFKIVAHSAALEEGLATPDMKIDCLGGGITIAGRYIRDHTPYGTLTMTEAMAKSSNVAAIKLGMKVGDPKMYEYIRRYGFGAKTGIELPGETVGLLRPVERWQKSSIGSIAIGQEIGVTPLQVAAAFATLANDGVRVAPHLVREIRDAEGKTLRRTEPESHRVVSAKTAHDVRMMLETVTLKGTAKRAQLEGYTAAGKTGTAQKIDTQTRAYSKTKHVASFAGFAPVENPSVVIVVVVDEPVGAYHGGDTAAPIFQEIADQILPYLNVKPDEALEPPAVAEEERLLAQAAHAAEVERRRTEEEAARAPLPEVVRSGGLEGSEVREVVYAAAAERALLMPDLRGRSVKDAARVCEQLGLKIEARGEGRAVSQSPAAGASVASGEVVRIDFGRSE